MGGATYRIVPGRNGWSIAHEGRLLGSYATKEAAFEAAVLPASNAIKEGHFVTVTVEGSDGNKPALGKS